MRWDNLRLDEPLETAEGGDLFTAAPGPGAPADRARRGRPHLRHAGFPWHDLLRGAGQVRGEPGARGVPDAVQVDHQPLPRLPACLRLLPGGETPILMADGRTKPLAEVRAGDGIYGTVRRGCYRRYVRTTVLAHWSTVKPAYRVVLEDGTQLVCQRRSPLPDRARLEARHRGRVRSALRRPHLTVNNKLMGVGGIRRAAQGDRRLPARLPVRHDPRRRDHRALLLPQRTGRDCHIHCSGWRWPTPEGLARTATTWPAWASAAAEFTFTEESADAPPRMTAIRTGSARSGPDDRMADRLAGSSGRGLAQGLPGRDLRRRGQLQRGILRIANTDPDDHRLDQSSSLESLGFGFAGGAGTGPTDLPTSGCAAGSGRR